MGLSSGVRHVALGTALLAGCAAAAAGAAGRETGTVVLRLVTDPSPPGVSWVYSGLDSSFQLGRTGSVRTVSNLAAGTYDVVEAAADPGQPRTLTGIACSDPSRDTTVDLAASSATIALAAGETVTCTFTHRALGPHAAASAFALARRFAPVLHLAAGERFRPLRLEDYLSRSVLRSGAPPHGVTSQTQPTLFSLPTTTTTATYLDIRGAQPYSNASLYPSIEQALEAAYPRPTVYWHLVRQASTGRTAIEYWFMYLYNDFLDKHEGDWEGLTVFLRNGTPIGAAYSQHQGRQWAAWPKTAGQASGLNAYVARGSHAVYPQPGRYQVRVCWTLQGRHCSLTRVTDDARGTGTTLALASYDLSEFGGAGYSGSWGSGDYILGVGLTKDRVTDPRRRSEYTNPFTEIPQ